MDRQAYQDMARTERTHWWFVGRRRIIFDTIAALSLPRDCRILEAGAGTGGNLERLAQFGRLTAIELDDDARAHARNATGVDVLEGRLPDGLPDFGEGFDLICLFDVLEHVEQDVETLTVLGRLLKPGGRILVTIPAYPWMWSSHDVMLHHFRRYTRATLADVVARAGLHSDRVTHFNCVLLPAAISARMVSKVLRRERAPGAAVPPSPVNKLFGSVLSAESRLLRHMNLPFGLSLMAMISADAGPSS